MEKFKSIIIDGVYWIIITLKSMNKKLMWPQLVYN